MPECGAHRSVTAFQLKSHGFRKLRVLFEKLSNAKLNCSFGGNDIDIATTYSIYYQCHWFPNVETISSATMQSALLMDIGMFRSISAFCTALLKVQNLLSMNTKLFHLVGQSSIRLSSLPCCFFAYFCRTASFFVGDLRNILNTCLTFSII